MRNQNEMLPEQARGPKRRQVIAGIGIGVGSLAAASVAWATANDARTALHQEVDFKAGVHRIYEALLDSKQFTALTGMAAEIDPKAGGAFTTFGGMIAGRNIELVPDQRIVQAWRPTHWDPGVYSIVKFELKPRDSQTTVVLDHTGFPAGDYDSLSSGWAEHYWNPLKKYLG